VRALAGDPEALARRVSEAAPRSAPPRLLQITAGAGVLTAAGVAALLLAPGRPPVATARDRASVAAPDLAARARAVVLAGGRGSGRSGPLPALAPPPADPRHAGALARGLAGYWRFDEAAGSPLARDLSGNGHDCQLHRMDPARSWIDGPLGGGLMIDATGWLTCPQAPAAGRATDELSGAAWIKLNKLRKYHGILASRHLGKGLEHYVMFAVYKRDLVLRSHAWGPDLAGAIPAPLDRWIHVAFTRRGDGVAKLFVDGAVVAEAQQQPGDHPVAGAPANTLYVGAGRGESGSGVVQRFYGAMDELLLYDRALSDEEIAALATRTQPRLSP
jgi:hypothetical protein